VTTPDLPRAHAYDYDTQIVRSKSDEFIYLIRFGVVVHVVHAFGSDRKQPLN
jgi:hypothetical protein